MNNYEIIRNTTLAKVIVEALSHPYMPLYISVDFGSLETNPRFTIVDSIEEYEYNNGEAIRYIKVYTNMSGISDDVIEIKSVPPVAIDLLRNNPLLSVVLVNKSRYEKCYLGSYIEVEHVIFLNDEDAVNYLVRHKYPRSGIPLDQAESMAAEEVACLRRTDCIILEV